MKPLLILFAITFAFLVKAQTCTALYSYNAVNEILNFTNQSILNNAHYYWNFGDGTSSNLKSPTHEFGENGNYLVTLYVHDTISNCSNYYEQWITVIKLSSDVCSPSIGDSIYSQSGYDLVKILNFSANCSNYSAYYSTLGNNGSAYDTYILPIIPGNFISTVRYYNPQLQRAAYKTLPWNYDRSKNYGGCSANFEFSVVSEDSGGQRILFKAMNKNASRYTWVITGFGQPIISNYDTVSYYYAGNPYSQFPNLPIDMFLSTQGQSGCLDSLWQSFIVRHKSSTYVGIKENDNIILNVTAYPNPTKNKITLELQNQSITDLKLDITNILGQSLYTIPEFKTKESIDLSFLPGGLYFLNLHSEKGNKSIKVFKE